MGGKGWKGKDTWERKKWKRTDLILRAKFSDFFYENKFKHKIIIMNNMYEYKFCSHCQNDNAIPTSELF